MNEEKTIGERIRIWGIDKYGSVNALAEALGIAQESVSMYLNDKRRPGIKFQENLKRIGADVDWIMTGRTATPIDPSKGIYIAFSGTASDELKQRTQKLAEWLLKYGQGADAAYLGFVSQKFLEGKILDAEGKEIS